MWEFSAIVQGWTDAHKREGDAEKPPEIDDERADELLAQAEAEAMNGG